MQRPSGKQEEIKRVSNVVSSENEADKAKENGTLSENDLDAMLIDMITRHMKTDAKLPTEKQMISELGVSRVRLREALSAFEKDGVISTIQGSGRYVVFPDLSEQIVKSWSTLLKLKPEMIFDLIEIRKILEIGTYPMVLERITSQQLQQLSTHVFTMQSKAEKGLSFEHDDRAFHRILNESCGNYIVQQLLNAFGQLLDMTPFNKKHADLCVVANQHGEMLEALAKGDITQLIGISQQLAADLRYRVTIATTKPKNEE